MSLAIASPGWIAEQRRELAEVTDAFRTTTFKYRETLERCRRTIDSLQNVLLEVPATPDRLKLIHEAWHDVICDSIRAVVKLLSETRDEQSKSFGFPWCFGQLREVTRAESIVLDQLIELARTLLIRRPEFDLVLPADLEATVWTVRISPLAYLRAMGNLFWSAIRHPLSETTIDLSTGRVLYRT
jgi:hypothetical protein